MYVGQNPCHVLTRTTTLTREMFRKSVPKNSEGSVKVTIQKFQ